MEAPGMLNKKYLKKVTLCSGAIPLGAFETLTKPEKKVYEAEWLLLLTLQNYPLPTLPC